MHVDGIANAPVSVMPTVVVAPGASVPFHPALTAVRVPPASVAVPFHIVTLDPDHGMENDQLLIVVDPVLAIATSMLRPVPQSDVTLTATLRAEPETGAVLADEVGVGVGVGVTVGVGVGVGVGVALEAAPATTTALVRACGLYSQLFNIAEDLHHARRRRLRAGPDARQGRRRRGL